MKVRDKSVDILKGVLIILVIMLHNNPAGSEVFSNSIAILRMPLFIAVSCIFLKPFSFTFLKRRVLLVLLPYFILEAQAYIFENYFESLWNQTFFIYPANYVHLWFLPVIFVVNVGMSIFLKFNLIENTTKGRIFFFFLLTTSTLISVFNEEIANMAFQNYVTLGIIILFFLAPLIVVIHRIWIHKPFKESWSNFIIFSFIFVSSLLFYAKFFGDHKVLNFIYFEFPSIEFLPLLYMMTISVFLSLQTLPKKLSIFVYVGQHSYPIYILHWSIMSCLQGLLFDEMYLIIDDVLDSPEALAAANVFYHLSLYAFIVAIAIITSKILLSISPNFKYIGMTSSKMSIAEVLKLKKHPKLIVQRILSAKQNA